MRMIRAVTAGALAGAAGTTALNTVTYLDMVWRARPASSTPEATVERLAEVTRTRIPGSADERSNRIAGLGPLTGLMVSTGVGAVLGLARTAGYRPGLLISSLTASVAALIGSNGPMTIVGITDPHTWSRADWVSDLVPHLAYGMVTAGALQALEKGISGPR
jgi:hypothetical protein